VVRAGWLACGALDEDELERRLALARCHGRVHRGRSNCRHSAMMCCRAAGLPVWGARLETRPEPGKLALDFVEISWGAGELFDEGELAVPEPVAGLPGRDCEPGNERAEHR
jgi:hypothetical protein